MKTSYAKITQESIRIRAVKKRPEINLTALNDILSNCAKLRNVSRYMGIEFLADGENRLVLPSGHSQR